MYTPRTYSWATLSRPLRQAQGRLFGTSLGGNVHPGLTSWATLSRPYGTGLGGNVYPQDLLLGYSQPSLRDWSRWECIPPGLTAGLLSAVPSGLVSVGMYTPRTYVLGYSQ